MLGLGYLGLSFSAQANLNRAIRQGGIFPIGRSKPYSTTTMSVSTEMLVEPCHSQACVVLKEFAPYEPQNAT